MPKEDDEMLAGYQSKRRRCLQSTGQVSDPVNELAYFSIQGVPLWPKLYESRHEDKVRTKSMTAGSHCKLRRVNPPSLIIGRCGYSSARCVSNETASAEMCVVLTVNSLFHTRGGLFAFFFFTPPHPRPLRK